MPGGRLAKVKTPLAMAKEKKQEPSSAEKKIQARQADLENSEWEIRMASQDPKAKIPASDKIVFKAGKVEIESFNKMGYSGTPYTLTPVPNTESGVWETVQRNGEGGMLTLRGDWNGERMTGVISESLDEGKKVTTYDFTSFKKSALREDAASENTAKPAQSSAPSNMKALVSKESSTPDKLRK